MRKLVIAVTVIVLTAAPSVRASDLPQPVQIVANVLELSESQVVSWVDLLRARETAVRPLQQELQAKQQAIAAALQSSSPDPAVVGVLVVAAHTIELQIAAIVQQTTSQFEETLSDEQREKLNNLREVAHVCPVVPAFQATGLL